MKATLQASYTHPAGLLAANQGSMQPLADGRVLVGWGNLPYFSASRPPCGSPVAGGTGRVQRIL